MADQKTRAFKPYKMYVFRTQDPVIDLFRAARNEGKHKVSHVAKESGVSPTTLHNWLNRKTRRPQFATVAAAARAMGIEDKVAVLIRGNRYR